VLDETGLVEDYQIEGTFPMFGNNDKGVDQAATSAVGSVSTQAARPPEPSERASHPLDPPHTMNVAYGKVHFVQPMLGRQQDVIHREVRGA
jgi:formate C-acetyltransferase